MPRPFFRIIVTVLTTLMCAVASAFGANSDFYRADAGQAALTHGTILKSEPISLPALFRGQAWRILYTTQDYAGRPLIASGIVVASTVKLPRGHKRSIIAWAHPTVGTSINCAPSMRQQPAHYILGLQNLIGAGQIVVATDYPGLGTPGPIGYLVGKGQARAILDAVRTVARTPSFDTSPNYAIYGYSQGAHAALFAAQEAPSYLPELTLRGTAAIAPPTDLAKLFAANANSAEGRVLMSYTLQSWAIKYGMSLRDVLTENAIGVAQHINTVCVDSLGGELDVYSAQGNFKDNMFRTNPLAIPEWHRRVSDNSLTVLPVQTPLLIVQGSHDSVVLPKVTMAAVRATCRAGGHVKLSYLAGKSHHSSAAAAFPAVTDWLVARLAGIDTQSSCH